MPRFYIEHLPAVEVTFELPSEVAHHALRVLRAQVGDTLTVFNGQGVEAELVVESTTKHHATARVLSAQVCDRESPLPLVLAQGLCTADKMDWVIEKAVELGVTAIQPLQTEKSVLRLDAERAQRKLAHWQEIVRSACGQSGRNTLPTVWPVQPLNQWLVQWRAARPSLANKPGALWMLTPRATQTMRQASLATTTESPTILLIGPEGGLSPAEEALAHAQGAVGFRLGPRILRTETAGLAALAALQALYGDLG